MSTTQRTGAAVTLSLRDPIAVRAAIIRELVTSARFIADLASQYTLDPLNALGDDTTQTDLERSLDIATNLLANVVTIDGLGVLETDDDDLEPPLPPSASTPRRRRTRCARRPASTLAIAAPASLAGIALLTRAARRR